MSSPRSHSLTLRSSRVALFASLLLAGAHSVFGQSAPGYQAPGKPQVKEESIQTRAARGQAPLAKLHGELKSDAAKIKRLPRLDRREKRAKSEKLLQVGVVRPLAAALNPLTDGASYSVAEGDVNVSAIASPEARYLRIHFANFSLPPGARVFVYSTSNPDSYAGPFESRGPWNDGNFWTPSLPGDQVTVEYLSPTGKHSAEAPFVIPEIAHIYKDEFTTAAAGSCNQEVPSPWAEVAKSVGMLQFVTGGLVAACTGTLLSDSNPTADHHVLTANHCISTQSEAQSAQIFWNYNSGDNPPGGTPSSSGANLMVTGTASDFTLLRFAAVPAGLYYSGWDASPVGPSTSVTGIHHPQGSHKRISFGTTNSNCASPLPGPCANFSGVTWNQGITEPGSSGSGIWSGPPDNAKFVGTLTGGESACDNAAGSDYYGRFSVTYPNISAFLNGTSCVTSISPTSQSFSASGGTGTLNVTAPAACSWSVSSTAAFLSITSGTSGTGNGTINFSVAANDQLQRSGSLVVGTQLFTINQAGGGICAPAPISIGQTVNGTLSTSDCRLDDGSYVDAYSFNGTAGLRISILMTSSAFDTFLYLLNPDGSILAINDDGGGGSNSRIPPVGSLTLPVTGSYTILANSFDAGATGAYSLTLNQTVIRTLTVVSQNANAVTIPVNPPDNNGATSGTTQFTATYDQGTGVNLFAPGSLPDGSVFQKWMKDGVDTNQPQTALVTMDTDHTMTVVYGPPILFTLTVASSNPDSGVGITVSPNDNNGQGSGTTQFTRSYRSFAIVNVTAPATAPNGNIFKEWRRNGQLYNTSATTGVVMDQAYTMTAVYSTPTGFTVTVASQNPSSGVAIKVTPNDNGGSGDGVTQFTRNYNQNTVVTVTAPATASNGNIFDGWRINGTPLTFLTTTNVTITANTTLTAAYLIKPVIFAEEGTNNVAALDSVTYRRGPFRILNPLNFSSDQHTRIIFFTSDLGLTMSDLSTPGTLGVQVGPFTLQPESLGPFTGVPGVNSTYIIVRLPDGLPAGALDVRVILRGTSSDVRKLNIAP